MNISCQVCQSKYTIADAAVAGKTAKMKCRACGAVIVVNPSGSSHEPTSAGAQGQGEPMYTVHISDAEQRPMNLEEVVQACEASSIGPDTLVWTEGMPDWQPLSQVEAITSRLVVHGGGTSPATATTTTRSSVVEPVREPLSQLGQRDESSVLFSLSALTQKSSNQLPGLGSSSQQSTTEDSGLIDLRALISERDPQSSGAAQVSQAGHGTVASVASLLPDSAGLFQFGPPPEARAPTPAKSNVPLVVGIGIALVAVVGVVGAVVWSSQRVAPDVVTLPAQPPAPPSAEPSATVAAASGIAPSGSASAALAAEAKEDDTKAGSPKAGLAGAPKKGVFRGPTRGAPVPPAAEAAPEPPKPPPPPPPKRSPCGCAPNDLMCAMKCSAGK